MTSTQEGCPLTSSSTTTTLPVKEIISKRRKLRPLVITLGNKRRTYIETLFNEPCMKEYFEPPAFSPGIPSRELRSCYSFLKHASRAGIIPQHEWEAIVKAKDEIVNDKDKRNNDHLGLLECLNDIPVLEGRRGSEQDIKRHYCKELWQKAKGINRGRNVLACSFAHLNAMKMLVEEGYDFILEDNVRAPTSEIGQDQDASCTSPCAKRIYDAIEASQEWEKEHGKQCHLRYYGWLGSRPNLEFVINTHCPRTRYKRSNENESELSSIFPFPVTSDFAYANIDNVDNQEKGGEGSSTNTPQKAGGTPIWGAYAYWISKEGHKALIDSLQKDVGSLLWKGKRMRYHQVKPIDKVMPRKVISAFSTTEEADDGRECIHVSTDPAFFRAPMLTSQIHSQWDAEFCRSTEYQMISCLKKNDPVSCSINEGKEAIWDTLWLTKEEREIIAYKKQEDKWLTLDELSKLSIQDK
jgi:hypothetical protein